MIGNFIFKTFDLGTKVKSRSQDFQGVVAHTWCIVWSKSVWNPCSLLYINNMAYQFTLLHLTFDEIEKANQVHWVISWL